MRILLILLLIVLSGCSTVEYVRVKDPFPEAPAELMKAPEKLKPITLKEGEKLTIGKLMEVITENYYSCYKNAEELNSWQEWYKLQKKTYQTD